MSALASARYLMPEQLTPLPAGLLHYPGVRCPSCGGRAFDVGRITAECARCGDALLLTNSDPLSEAKGTSQ